MSKLTPEEAWQNRLDALRVAEASEYEPTAKFKLQIEIAEASAKLAEIRKPSASVLDSGPHFDISRIDRYAPKKLIGRGAETKLLASAWDKVVHDKTGRPHVITIVALGGEGKTSLVARWAVNQQIKHWPGCDAVYAWSFYSQGTREQMAASSNLFLKEALTFFGDPATADSTQGAHEKGQRLAQLVGERRALLILDGLEPLQYAPTSPTPGELKDLGLIVLLKGLAASNRGLCVVTTRYSLADLRAYWKNTVKEVKLTRLARAAGVQLLQSFGVKGSRLKDIPSPDGRELWNEFEKLVEDVQGHALTLNLLGSYLRDAHDGDISKRDLVKLEEADAEEQGGHAFRVMDAYVQSFESEGKRGQRGLAMLRLLGLFDRPATADCLVALCTPPAIPDLTEPLVELSDPTRNMIFTRLKNAKLLTVNRDAGKLIWIDTHPLIRDYMAFKICNTVPRGWREAHLRLAKCYPIPDSKHQKNLNDIYRLYTRIRHLCLAGESFEALEIYKKHVAVDEKRKHLNYPNLIPLDLSALAYFFVTPWSELRRGLGANDSHYLFHTVALQLWHIGRLNEAMKAAEMARESVSQTKKNSTDYENLCRTTRRQSEISLFLGNIGDAVKFSRQSFRYAESAINSDAYKIIAKCALAHALFFRGDLTHSYKIFSEKYKIDPWTQRQIEMHIIYRFIYIDVLLHQLSLLQIARRSIKSNKLGGSLQTKLLRILELSIKPISANLLINIINKKYTSILTKVRHILDATKMPQYTHLLLEAMRIVLHYKLTVLEKEHLQCDKQSIQDSVNFNFAVTKFHEAGQEPHTVRGFLFRAEYSIDYNINSASRDLDDAWEIADRRFMPLLQADVLLLRARLFRKLTEQAGSLKYPWKSPQADLAEARRLIEKCGYWRRKEELEDAEKAILTDAKN
jgi:tetratricopeptide (TPR) repeat protein